MQPGAIGRRCGARIRTGTSDESAELRVLICANAYPPHFVGGAELVAHQLALQMVDLGHEVAVFAGRPVDQDEPRLCASDLYEGLRVHRVARTQHDYDIAGLNYVNLAVDSHFQEVLGEFRPDIVHCHNLMGLSARIPMLAAEAGARVFLTLHDFWGFCLRNTLTLEDGSTCTDWSACQGCLPPPRQPRPQLRARRDLLTMVFDHIDRFIYPSVFMREKYRIAGFPDDRAASVRNGIDITRFADVAPFRRRTFSPQDPFRAMFAGYLGPHKGVQLLPRTVAAMRNRGRIRLELYGEGPLDTSLRAQIAQYDLGSAIRFKGKLQPVAMVRAYEQADALVLPSIWSENQPVCIMEAMACARPVVASRIGGIPEMITDGREGLLCPPDSPEALAAALDCLVESPDEAMKMGRRAYDRVAGQTYQRQAIALLDLFAETISAPVVREPERPIFAVGMKEIADGATSPDFDADAYGAHYVVPEDWLTPRLRLRTRDYHLTQPEASLRLNRKWQRFSR